MEVNRSVFADLAMLSKYKKIYFEFIDGVPVNEMTYVAYMGLKGKTQCIPIGFENLGDFLLGEGEMAIGGLEFTMTALKNRCSLVDPTKVIHIPDGLKRYKLEKVVKTTLKQLADVDIQYPIRTLPINRLNDSELIMLMSKEQAHQYVRELTNEEDRDIIVEEVKGDAIEYNAYVCNGSLLDIRGKSNISSTLPDVSFVNKLIEEYVDAPNSYVMNLNVYNKQNGETLTGLDSIQGGYSFPTNGLSVFGTIKMLIYSWDWFIQQEKKALSEELLKSTIN